jgi:hypothetical protein
VEGLAEAGAGARSDTDVTGGALPGRGTANQTPTTRTAVAIGTAHCHRLHDVQIAVRAPGASAGADASVAARIEVQRVHEETWRSTCPRSTLSSEPSMNDASKSTSGHTSPVAAASAFSLRLSSESSGS